MAPGTRRANRSGYAEHDDFEGLPVRQWRQDWVNVAPPQPQEQVQQNDIWAIELIHGMPKDSALLAPHSQELLRAARSGRLYKRPAPAEEEEADTEAAQVTEKAEKKDEENAVQGFSIKLWRQIPRNNEGPGLSHLAKRRKGTVTISSKTIEEKTAGPTVTRATVRKIDAAGNPYTEEVTLADGQQVVGEIISTRVEAAPAAVAEGFVAPAPPQRRRPPPPKRKSKAGPGRGKKKIKNPPPGEGLAAGVTPAANGVGAVNAEGLWEHGTLQEGTRTPNPDSGMADGDGDGDGDDDEDDDDGEDGDDGDDGDDDDQEEGDQQGDDADDAKYQDEEMTDAMDEPKPPTPSKPVFHAMDGIATLPDVAPPNPLTLAPSLVSLAANSPKNEGSPLKNVMLQAQSPTESHAPPVIPTNAAEVAPVPAAVPVELPALETVISKVIEPQPPETESMVAEPPTTFAGDEGQVRADMDITMSKAVPRKADEAPAEDPQGEASYKGPSPYNVNPFPDVPSRDEALLPPPPEQVGNISSPRAYDGPDRVSDVGDKSRDGQMIDSGMVAERPPLNVHDSVMTEDTINPEDSASVRYQMTGSGAPSEVGTASAEETKDSAVARVGPVAEASRESFPPEAACPMEETETEMTAPAGPLSGKTSDGTRRVSPVAPASVLGDDPQAPEARASPQTLGQESFAESKEPTPSEAVRDEHSPALKRAVQDSPRLNTPEQTNPVTVLEPKPYENVEAEPVPEVQDVQEPASTTRDEKSRRGYGEEQSQEPVGEREQESQDEHRNEPMKEAKPPAAMEPEPFPVAKPAPIHLPEEAPSASYAVPVPEAAPAPAPPLISPPILPPIADIASEIRLADGAEGRKEDPPAGA